MLAESKLKEYQHLIVNHILSHPKCAVWAAMGLGKTVSTLTAVERLQFCGHETKPTLVIAPLRVAKNVWPNEVREWEHLAHLKVVPIIGSAAERKDALYETADLYTINFENLDWLINTWGDHWPYGMIVVDESTKLKSLRANIRQNAEGKRWVQGQGGVRAKSLLQTTFKFNTPRIVELTGTPSPNGLQDLWGQIFFLDYGKRLGRTIEGFKTRWFQRKWDGFGLEALPHAQAEIEAALKDIVISLRTEDWFDLKKPIEREIWIDLPESASKQYRELERKFYTEIQGHPIEAFNAGAKTAKLRQLAAGAAYLGTADDPGERQFTEAHAAKLDALEEIEEEAGGMPLLVAYHFKSDLIRIQKRFPHAKVLDTKASTITDWNAGKISMLLAHPASAGHGLNLQRGSNILVYFNIDWNLEQQLQILERIGPVRQAQAGLNRNVFVYRILARNTVDEDLLDNNRSKGHIQDALMKGLTRRLQL